MKMSRNPRFLRLYIEGQNEIGKAYCQYGFDMLNSFYKKGKKEVLS